MQSDRDEIKEMLRTRIEDLCAKLLPDGRRQGRLWVSYNPVTCDFGPWPPCLKVALTADRGAWKDWRSGDKGDVIGLVQYIKGLDFKEAMAWSRDFLGLREMSAADRRALDAKMRQQKRESDDNAERIRLWKISRAEQLFLEGAMLGAGSAAEAHAKKYFAGRDCALEGVTAIDEATFRFSPGQEYWKLAEYRTGGDGRKVKGKDGPKFPAVLSAMRGPTGLVTACHCTFLDPVKPKKIALGGDNPPKLIFGEAKGAVIRLTHGPEGVPPELATCATPVVICEGIETGLSLASAIPGARIWAAGSLSNMGNAPVWLDCVGGIVVARDNNDGNAQAQKQLGQVLAQLEAAGKPLAVMASHVGDDFNDLAKGEE